MKWILILIVTTGASAPATISTIEFNSNADCNIARFAIQDARQKLESQPLKPPVQISPNITINPALPFLPNIIATCVER